MSNQIYLRRKAIYGAACLLIFVIIFIILYFTEWRSPSPPSPHRCNYCYDSSNLGNNNNFEVFQEDISKPTGYVCCNNASNNLFCCDQLYPHCCANVKNMYSTNLCCDNLYLYTCPYSSDYLNCTVPSKGDLNPIPSVREVFQEEIEKLQEFES